MPRSSLSALIVSSAICLVGCAGPGWFTRVDLRSDRTADRERSGESHTADSFRKPVTTDTTHASERSLSLSQLIDEVDRMKSENPSDYAVLQSRFEDLTKNIPAQYRQAYADQFSTVTQPQQSQILADIRGNHDVISREPVINRAASTQPAHASAQQTNTLAPATSPPIETALPNNVPAVRAEPTIAPIVQAVQHTSATTLNESQRVASAQFNEPLNQSTPAQVAPVIAATREVLQQSAMPEETVPKETVPVDWNQEVEDALKALEADLSKPNLPREERARLEVVRRFLYVVTNQRDAAASPIEQLDEDEQEFVKHQMNALSIWLDADGKHPTTRRAALSLRDLRVAANHLANVSTLDVRNIAFCKEVLSYGEHRRFDSYSFRPNAEVVLYVEVDNFAVHQHGDDFETELHGSYEITDEAGRRVANVVLQVDKQLSRNRRRDYFIAYLIKMPTNIAPGSYRLRLIIEDIIGKKSNYAAIDFRIE